MSVQGINASTNPYVPNTQAGSVSAVSEFKNLVQAIQSGDLKTAQSAYSQLQGLVGNNQVSQSTSTTQSASPQNQLSSDFAAIGKALQSGDMNSAQSALKKLGEDLQSARKTHRHHHHHGAHAPSDATTSSSAASGVAAASGTAGSAGSGVNLLL